MARYVDALAQERWFNKVLLGVTGVAAFLAVIAMMGWRSAGKDLDLHIPPDLSKGATIKAGSGEVPPPNVYTFGFYIWQQLNRWSKNGQQDYGEQIFKLQAYFTPSCQEQLIADHKLRSEQGELDQRTRSVMEIPGLGYVEDRVTVLADGSWTVLIDAQVQETSRGVPVKDAFIRYPLHIVRYDVDRERNPWKLAVDCYASRPERLDPKAVEVARASAGAIVQNNEAYASKSLGDGAAELGDLGPTGAGPRAAASATAGAVEGHTPSSGASQARVPEPTALAPAVLPRVLNP